MIAVDTNVLVRYFVEDDAHQSAIARAFIEGELTSDRPGLVTIVAIVELGWVLQGVYGASASTVVEIIHKLLNAGQVVVEQADAVEAAITRLHSDLADALIHEIGKSKGCEKTVTFDRRFAQMRGVELLKG